MARAMWKGVLRVGDEGIPVKFYSAARDRTVRFRLLDRTTGRRVRQRMIRPDTGDVVPREEIHRGYPVPGGGHVILDESELEALEPEKSRDIRVETFLPPAVIGHVWYRRPYHLGPDGGAATYYALVDALAEEEMAGLAHWTMRNTRYVGALRVVGDHLMMVTLRRAGEVLEAGAIDAPEGREPQPRELRMAEQLVDALSDDFDPEAFRDEYRDRVLDFIQARARGENIRFPRAADRAGSEDLAERLEASLAVLEERKSA